MTVERTNKEIIVRLPASTDIDELQDMVDMLEYKRISSKSKATQDDVDSLVNSIKKGRWDSTKSKLTQ